MDCSDSWTGRPGPSSLPLPGLGSGVSCNCQSGQIESQTTAKTCCECENGARRSIYLDHSSDSGDSLPRFQRNLSAKDMNLVELDIGRCRSYDLQGLESARKNNSIDSPSSSSAAVIPSLEPHWHLHDSMCTDTEIQFSGLRSATESLAPNNYLEEDGGLGGIRDSEKGHTYWNHASTREEQFPPSNTFLVSSLEHTIAVLSVGFKQHDEIEHEFGSMENLEDNFALQSFARTADIHFASESTLGPPETLEKIELDSLDLACSFPFQIPTPCAMPCTRQEQMAFPMEVVEESSFSSDKDQLESPYLPPSCAAERSSPLYCWTPESMSIPGGHSSRKSWACQRKSTSRGAASISMSDWDVYEAGIQIKRPRASSDSDGAFEEFVREQEAHFTPPVVLAGDVWDPLEHQRIPGGSFLHDSEKDDASCLSATSKIEPTHLTCWHVPIMHDVGVQVCSADLKLERRPTFFGRLLGRSSDARSKLITAWKTTRMRPWLSRTQRLQTSPAAIDLDPAMEQPPSTTLTLVRSESPITMVSIESQSCGLHTQLKKLVPRRFIQNTPRNDMPAQFINDAAYCSTTHDDIFYLDNSLLTGETSQTGHSRHHEQKKGGRRPKGPRVRDRR